MKIIVKRYFEDEFEYNEIEFRGKKFCQKRLKNSVSLEKIKDLARLTINKFLKKDLICNQDVFIVVNQ